MFFFKWLWLSAQHKWPNQPKVSKSPENDKKIVKPKHEKQPLVKEQKQRQRIRDQNLLLVATFLRRFINNCRKLNRQKGPLKTKELHAAEAFWVIQAQASKSEKWLKKGREGSIEMCWHSSPLSYSLYTKNCKLATLIIQQVQSK